MATEDAYTGHGITLKELQDAFQALKTQYYATSVTSTARTFARDVMRDPTLSIFRSGAIGEPKRIIRSVPQRTPAKAPIKAPEPEKVPVKTELE